MLRSGISTATRTPDPVPQLSFQAIFYLVSRPFDLMSDLFSGVKTLDNVAL